ncbi:multicopper oxidase domain-containing protein [Nitrosomonas sp. Is24]|uniref:multicopper oxidase domain-containing protein n=1 Tax=Nitrosomonas sp. Is24 TaxID=3080533 RepID=UPI00294ADBA9|nr:multicopper oxidase domain-containing protein [Nitrosomonas sp. Is24]MDV6341338.1 multicopper oxidase domain-containing protein [Nitrosomonas sp. Is24]
MPIRIVIALLIFSLLSSAAVQASLKLPETVKVDPAALTAEPMCDPKISPAWREAQEIDGVKIAASPGCSPDNPAWIAAAVKGTNHVSMDTLMKTGLSPDAIIKTDDLDGDGDPDRIIIKLEIMELNGKSPDFPGLVPTFDIAPGVQPGAWVFAPKTSGMSTENFESVRANPLLRLPSPVIRVEVGDIVQIVLENTHYFPHSIHLHGVDHPFSHKDHGGNDGVPQTSEKELMPGERRIYEFQARQPGTMFYHCHVQTHTHLAMGLAGMIVVEENRPNNWLQTLNIGAGHVRHSSVAVRENYDQEYDLHYHAMDKELSEITQKYNDPRLIARDMNQRYDITDATEDYYTLNGLSFPYTLRESLIIVEPDQKIKLRLLNSGGELIAVHTHGHHATITHYDGVEHNPVAQIMRDVFDMAPAQRLDLKLETVNDGKHSYGEGDWLIHDHREKGITTNGMAEGGSMSSIVYKSYLNDSGLPQVSHFGIDLNKFFTKEYYERRIPVWQDLDEWSSLGSPGGQTSLSAQTQTSLLNGVIGLLIGLVIYLIFAKREQIKQSAIAAVSRLKGAKGSNQK